jgi:hypothetical protein
MADQTTPPPPPPPPSSTVDPTFQSTHLSTIAKIKHLDAQLTTLHTQHLMNNTMYNITHRVATILLSKSANTTHEDLIGLEQRCKSWVKGSDEYVRMRKEIPAIDERLEKALDGMKNWMGKWVIEGARGGVEERIAYCQALRGEVHDELGRLDDSKTMAGLSEYREVYNKLLKVEVRIEGFKEMWEEVWGWMEGVSEEEGGEGVEESKTPPPEEEEEEEEEWDVHSRSPSPGERE